MTAVLLDTHAWAWTLGRDPRLSHAAQAAIAGADQVLVSPISFFEIGQWAHGDPFDRLIAATALHYRLPLVSADTVFDGVVDRRW